MRNKVRILVLLGCYRKKMNGKEKEIYDILYKKKQIDDKTPKLRTEDDKKMLKCLFNKMRKFPTDLIDEIKKKLENLPTDRQRTIREQTDRQRIQKLRPPFVPMDRRGSTVHHSIVTVQPEIQYIN